MEVKTMHRLNISILIDGRFITADGPKSSREFGRKIIGALKR